MNDNEYKGFGSENGEGVSPEGPSTEEYSLKKDQVPFGTYMDAPSVKEPISENPEARDAGFENAAAMDGAQAAYTDTSDAESSFGREGKNDREDHGYVDANFRPRTAKEFSYGSYYTPPEKPKKKEKKKGTGSFAKAVCMCLVCAVLGGLGGGAIVSATMPDSQSSGSAGGNLNISTGTPAPTPDASNLSSGTTLTGSQIYSLGCQQAVGVTTEITSRNYFGTETVNAVTGSGFIVTENGYVVTNYHVIKDAYEGGYKVSVILYNGESYPAEIVGVREEFDLAVLKIDASGLSAATLGSSDDLLVGDAVYAIGNPLGELNFSMTTGSVSAKDRSITTIDKTTNKSTTNVMFQIDAAVNEGNSGGPVYNDKGEVVGIVTAKYSDAGVEGLGFAIPISDVVDIIDQLVNVGYVSGMASFGITANTVDSATASYYNMAEGAYVLTVNEGSCSEKAGLKVGDIITAIDGTAITSSSELVNAKKNYRAGDTVTVTVYRTGEYIDLELTFDEESADSQSQTQTKDNSERQTLPSVPKG